MTVKVSVVIPSYNRYPQNRLTLYSLENQTVSRLLYEVILVDGGSTDYTSTYMKKYHPPFAFQYVRFARNLNRSATRNQGIYRAKGEIIIFLDAEVVVRSDFIEKHMRHHQRSEVLVVSGAMRGYQLCSTLDPKMSEDQINQLYDRIKHKPKYLHRCHLSLKNRKTHLRTLQQYRHRHQSPLRLLTRQDIYKGRYQELSISHGWVHMLFEQFGNHLQGYVFPWMLFVTRNVSVKRAMLNRAGVFDEKYEGFGHEDFDIGYRLYQQGAQFWNDPELPYYHQEHYTPTDERKQAYTQNVIYFLEKYKCLEIQLFSIMGLMQVNNLAIHHTCVELQTLRATDEHRCRRIIDIVEPIFAHMTYLLKQQKPLKMIAWSAGIDKCHPMRQQVKQLLIELNSLQKYTYIPQLLQTLMYR